MSYTENEMSHIANVKLLSRVYRTVELHHIHPFFSSLSFCSQTPSTLLNLRSLHVPHTDTPSFAITRTPGFGYPLREGIPVSLKCDVDSNPPSTAMWQKDDGDPPVTNVKLSSTIRQWNLIISSLASISPHFSSNRSCHQMPQSGDGLLNFTAIRREDSGWYKCTARHLNKPYSSFGYFLNVRCEY